MTGTISKFWIKSFQNPILMTLWGERESLQFYDILGEFRVKIPQDTLNAFCMDLMAPFSKRETCAWEIPSVLATSICVFPS